MNVPSHSEGRIACVAVENDTLFIGTDKSEIEVSERWESDVQILKLEMIEEEEEEEKEKGKKEIAKL